MLRQKVFSFLCAMMIVLISVYGKSAHGSTTMPIEDYPYLVLVNGKCGYMNAKGIVVIEPSFDWCDIDFSDGLAVTKV